MHKDRKKTYIEEMKNFFNKTSSIFITHYHGLELLAPYAAGFSLGAIVTFFHSTISFMLYPELSKKWVNKNKTNIINLMKKVVTA